MMMTKMKQLRRPIALVAILSFQFSSFVMAAGPVAIAPTPNALPTGAQVVSGSAIITQTANTVNVQQSTNKAIINWNTFNVGSNATVNFQQPGSSSVALNRILQDSASQIFGSINANGQVFFVNPNGIVFGQGSSINVGALVASTLNISNDDF